MVLGKTNNKSKSLSNLRLLSLIGWRSQKGALHVSGNGMLAFRNGLPPSSTLLHCDAAPPPGPFQVGRLPSGLHLESHTSELDWTAATF